MAPPTGKPARPREQALSQTLLTRVFHQPAMVYFRTTAELQSVRECARRLNVASSAVSRQIGQLEDALGMALFRRGNRRLRLTPAGEILYRHVARSMAPMEAAVSELDMLRGLRTGLVRIVTVESVGVSFLPAIMVDFSRRYPDLHLDVEVAPARGVVERLLDGSADIGFGFLTRPLRELTVVAERVVRLGALMHPSHPLAVRESVTLDACLEHPVAVGRRDLAIREAIQPILDALPHVPPPVLEVGSIRMLVELARLGRHLSIVTPIAANHELATGDLAFRPLAEGAAVENRFVLLIRGIDDLGFAPRAFHDHARDQLRSLVLPGVGPEEDSPRTGS